MPRSSGCAARSSDRASPNTRAGSRRRAVRWRCRATSAATRERFGYGSDGGPLEALGEPGGILISGKIHEEVDGKIEASFEDRGEQ